MQIKLEAKADIHIDHLFGSRTKTIIKKDDCIELRTTRSGVILNITGKQNGSIELPFNFRNVYDKLRNENNIRGHEEERAIAYEKMKNALEQEKKRSLPK